MSLDKYRVTRRKASWADAARGMVYELEEATAPPDKKAAALHACCVEAIAISVVEPDGTRILDSIEGRSIVASWPAGLVMELGAVCIELNGIEAKKKD
jgi:hypothetical protein